MSSHSKGVSASGFSSSLNSLSSSTSHHHHKRESLFAPLPSTTRGSVTHLSAHGGTTLLHTNGRSVFLRNLQNPAICSEYTGHTCQATVAKFSPSGYYVASADVQGNVRIWDATQEEHLIKSEVKALSGKINDLDWDFESKRLIAVGEGKDRFGHAFLFDTSSSVGELSGHSKAINSVSIRPGRPLRAVTGSDDMLVNFYHGVPFKFNKSIRDHTRFVQCVRYSPTGSHFATSSSDGKIFIYDGATGDRISELSGHTGSVFSISWTSDGKRILSASGDMSCRLWDVEAKSIVNTYSFSSSPSVNDQQVSALAHENYLLSLSLSGDLNYLDERESKPVKVVTGHQKAITTLAFSPKSKTLFSGSYDGRIIQWDNETAFIPEHSGHMNQIMSLNVNGDDGTVISTGMDDCVKRLVPGNPVVSVATDGIPSKSCVVGDRTVFVTSKGGIYLMEGAKVVAETKVSWTPTSCALSSNGAGVAVGSDQETIHIFMISESGSFESKQELKGLKGSVSSLAYSPDGLYLAAGDSIKNILVFDTESYSVKIDTWAFHSARINQISWSPDSQHAVSASLDTNLEVWSVEHPFKHIAIKGAHLESVNGVVFIDNNTIASVGQDATVKVWNVTY